MLLLVRYFVAFYKFSPTIWSYRDLSVKEREHDLLATENDIVAHRYSFLAFLFWHYIIVVLGIYHANLSLCTEVEKS